MLALSQSPLSIIQEIDAHMQKSSLNNSSWYVGFTSDIEQRLFGFHQVPRKDHWFIYRQSLNSTDARAVEAAYHKVGCRGSGGGGGDHSSVYVYGYVITAQTVE